MAGVPAECTATASRGYPKKIFSKKYLKVSISARFLQGGHAYHTIQKQRTTHRTTKAN